MNRKEKIQNAAVFLFARRGFASVSTSAIAKDAGVAEGLVFHYFKKKDDILFSILKQTGEEFVRGFQARKETCQTGLEVVTQFIEYDASFKEEHSDALIILFRDLPPSFLQEGGAHYEAINQGLSGILNLLEHGIEQGKKDGTIRDVPTKETARLIWGMLHGTARLELLEPVEVPDLTQSAIDFCARALERKL